MNHSVCVPLAVCLSFCISLNFLLFTKRIFRQPIPENSWFYPTFCCGCFSEEKNSTNLVILKKSSGSPYLKILHFTQLFLRSVWYQNRVKRVCGDHLEFHRIYFSLVNQKNMWLTDNWRKSILLIYLNQRVWISMERSIPYILHFDLMIYNYLCIIVSV